MKKAIKAFSLLGIAAGLASGDDPKVDRMPLNIGAAYEFGPVVKGLYDASQGAKGAEIIEGEWVDHFLAYFNHRVVVDDRLHLSAGLGGVFQFRKPEIPGLGFPSHQRKAFFIGPSTTEAVYHFGDLEKPWLKLGMGMFHYKYNPEAVNLGEYLFRGQAYPTFVRTGGYMVVNNAAAQMQGFKANFNAGNFNADLFLVTETGFAPLYDWSLAAVASYSVLGGFLTLGGGVNFQHLLSVRPSRTAIKTDPNSYFHYNGEDYSGNTEFYSHRALRENEIADTLEARNPADPRIATLRASAAKSDSIATMITNLFGDSSVKAGLGQKYFTAAGTVLMGRATLDVKKLFGGDLFGPEDLKLYGEVNVLGVRNYPVFYDTLTQRMPMMVGFNFPGFKILDLIALQAEYFNSPWSNNTFMRAGNRGGNIPYFPLGSDKVMSQESYYDAADKDNFKWSVLVRKNLGNLSITTQVASDHLNLTSSSYYYGPQFDPGEITAFKDHWYWMTQLSWGI